MQVTPVLSWSFDLHAGLRWEPVHVLRIGEWHGRKVDLRVQRFQADILQAICDARLNLRDGAGLRIDPSGPGKFQRIFPSTQSQRGRRFHAGNMFKTDLLENAAAHDFLSSQSEFESFRIIRVKDQKQRGEAIAQQHGSILAIMFCFAHRNARFGEIQLAASVRQDDQVVVGRVFFEFDLVIFPQLLLTHLLRAFHIRKLFEEYRHLIGGACEHIVQHFGFRGRGRRPGEAKPRHIKDENGNASASPDDLCLALHSPFLFESKR